MWFFVTHHFTLLLLLLLLWLQNKQRAYYKDIGASQRAHPTQWLRA